MLGRSVLHWPCVIHHSAATSAAPQLLPSRHSTQQPGPLTASIFSSFCARSTISPTSSAYLCSSSLSRSDRRKLASSVKETWADVGARQEGQLAL